MPFPFTLPTTSAASFSSSVDCLSHPSLPLTAATYRGVVRDALKKHKRLSPTEQTHHVSLVSTALSNYLPYLLALDAGLNNHRQQRPPSVNAVMVDVPSFRWRPSLCESPVPGRRISHVRVAGLDAEVAFAAVTLANCYALQARAALHPLYATSGTPISAEARVAAIQAATRLLLDAASVCTYAADRTDGNGASASVPCIEVSPAAARALAALNMAEATMLAVFKDDPYPAAVAQNRNADDREWMYKAPDIPKVRAHLFARLCLAAADHAARASALFTTATTASGHKLDSDLIKYITGLRQSCRAKACRLFGIDADLGGQMGMAIGWLNAGLQELGIDARDLGKKSGSSSFGKLRRDWAEKREDKRVEQSTGWGADGGKIEESRVIYMLHAKWTKTNDTMLAQAIPTPAALLGQMPSGREIHAVKAFTVPQLDPAVLDTMRAPPDPTEVYAAGGEASSDEEANDNAGRAYY
ncbi:hypothetical protein TD95_003287 [Thielaviopsis punctulata]|uniref:pH-response regulator protein palC n=1 Tax=Thielaviopsis punctulata TaxID=72032 RepID=A0A0F4ZE16_9PEZI|nr:hypothetical protein TD95_003287 [Thielaviopsis punctulata]